MTKQKYFLSIDCLYCGKVKGSDISATFLFSKSMTRGVVVILAVNLQTGVGANTRRSVV